MITRRELLLDQLAMVTMIQQMLSDHWTANMPTVGSEGPWEIERSRARILREWVQEMDAGVPSEKPDVWVKRVSVLKNGLVISEAIRRRLCIHGELNEPFEFCRGAWEREADKETMILIWIEEINKDLQEAGAHEMGHGERSGNVEDVGRASAADGGKPQAAAMEAHGMDGKAGAVGAGQGGRIRNVEIGSGKGDRFCGSDQGFPNALDLRKDAFEQVRMI